MPAGLISALSNSRGLMCKNDSIIQSALSFQKICRDKLCHSDRRPASDNCMLKSNSTRPRPCVSAYVKMTVLDGINLEVTIKQQTQTFLYALRQMLQEQMQVYGVIFKIDIFIDTKQYESTPSVYSFVVKLLLFPDAVYPTDVVKLLLSNIHQRTMRLAIGLAQLFCELATYDEIHNGTNKRIIYVPLFNDDTLNTMEWFGSREFQKTILERCMDISMGLIHKTHVCPYIKIRTHEFLTEFKNEFLVLKSQDMTSKLSPFEYRSQNGTLHICLSDFLPFYYSLSTTKPVSGCYALFKIGKMTQMYYLTLCFKISHQLFVGWLFWV